MNLPPGMDTIPGIAAAMARSHSYDWVLAAAEAPETDEEDGELDAFLLQVSLVFLTRALSWPSWEGAGTLACGAGRGVTGFMAAKTERTCSSGMLR